MDSGKATLVICLTIFIVVGINTAIYASLRRGTTVGQIEILRKTAGRIRNPWQAENEALNELSRLVEDLTSSNESDLDSQQNKSH